MNRREKTLCLVLLLAIITFSVVNAAVWVLFDTRPPRWDEAYYLTLSLEHHAALTSGGVNLFVQSLLDLDRKRPPLVPALAVFAHLLFGRWDEVALAVNLGAFVVALLAVYGLGARLGSRWGGLLAALLPAPYPGVFRLAPLFLLDFCDMALAALALYCLVRTQGFSRRRPAVALGVVAGLGLLCRAFFPVFLLGPLGLSVYGAWRASRVDGGAGGRPVWQVNSGLALLICLTVAAPWYIKNIAPLVLRSLRAAYGAHTIHFGPQDPLTV